IRIRRGYPKAAAVHHKGRAYPMIRRVKNLRVLGGAAALVLLSTACVQLAPPVWPLLGGARGSETPSDAAAVSVVAVPTASAAASPTSPVGRQTVAVRRGP